MVTVFFTYFSTLYLITTVRMCVRRCVRILGKQENIRVVQLSLFQGVANSMKAAPTIEMKASDNPALQSTDPDPTIFCTAFKKNRFYMVRTFTQHTLSLNTITLTLWWPAGGVEG